MVIHCSKSFPFQLHHCQEILEDLFCKVSIYCNTKQLVYILHASTVIIVQLLLPTGVIKLLPYTTKFLPKTHTMYRDKNFAKFNFTNRTSYLPGSCGWNSQVAIYVHMRMHSQSCECVKIFTVQKKSWQKFSPMACIGEIGKNSPGENFHVYGIMTVITIL